MSDEPESAGDGAAPVGPAGSAPEDKDMTLIAPPKPAKAKKPAKSAKNAKGAKGAKGKGKGKGKGGKSGASLASHPKAKAQIRAAKGWGGLGAFVITAYLSYQAEVPFDQIGLRAIAAGIAGYMVAWAFAVTFWRYLLLAELERSPNAAQPRARARSASGRQSVAQSRRVSQGFETPIQAGVIDHGSIHPILPVPPNIPPVANAAGWEIDRDSARDEQGGSSRPSAGAAATPRSTAGAGD